jgi:hypothetical protein
MKLIGDQKSEVGVKKVTNESDWCPKKCGR